MALRAGCILEKSSNYRMAASLYYQMIDKYPQNSDYIRKYLLSVELRRLYSRQKEVLALINRGIAMNDHYKSLFLRFKTFYDEY
jgi:hypothetical protein